MNSKNNYSCLKLKCFNLIIYFLLFAGFSKAQDLKTFRGFVEHKSELSRAGGLKEEKKSTIKRLMKPYIERETLLTKYFLSLNKNDTSTANSLLRSDVFFKNKDSFTIAYMFSLVRMQTLDELFKPCIQIYDDDAKGIVISCSKEQFADLTEDDTKIFEVTCRYIGELYVDNVKLYEMVRYR